MKKIFIFIMMFILMFSFVLAKPPFIPEPQILDANLVLETNFITEHPINTEFYLHTHVYNTSNGLRIDPNDLLCYYHLYDSNINWEHKDIGTLDPYGAGLFKIINETNFSQIGLYSILFWCETDEVDSIGGFSQFTFEVINEEGIFEFGLNAIYFMLIVAVALFILAIFIKQSLFGVFGAILLLFASIYLIPIIFIVGIIGVMVSLILGVLFAINI